MTQWKEPAVPRHVLQMLVVDHTQTLLLMHRSDKVRSAKNVWSIPSGEHEIGETREVCMARELHEEYGLYALDSRLVDQYENIAGDEQPPHYHWVISLYLIKVLNVRLAINKEPEKHDIMKFVSFEDLGDPKFFEQHVFHPSLHSLISNNITYWINQ